MKKILIVDDDPVCRAAIAGRLRPLGVATAFSGDGATAVGAARREKPDLILLDLGLPGGNGYVVMARLRSLTSVSGTPIVVVSGSPVENEEEKALAAGAHAFLSKPVGQQLLALVGELLGIDPIETERPRPLLVHSRTPQVA